AQLGDALDRVHYRRVVAPAEGLADLGEALLRELLREVHRDLARARDVRRTPLAVHVGDLDLQEVGDRLLDRLDGDRRPIQLEQILQCFLRELGRYRLAAETREG